MITINQAIEVSENTHANPPPMLTPLEHEALMLGIEALKYIRCRDNRQGVNTRLLLPGETKE